MSPRAFLAFAALVAGLLTLAPPAAQAGPGDLDFGLGKNSEDQTCRAVARFDTAPGEQAADVYCGAWEQPSGRLSTFTSASPAATKAEGLVCAGPRTTLASTDFESLVQVACTREGDQAARFALLARRGGKIVVGQAYPADWPGLLQAARVLTGAARRTAAAPSAGETPGMREIAAVFPAGAPGQSASARYELLRRRAYEYNASWSFATSTRDFQELLAAHRAIAPDDITGEAEILAEIGLNLSGARRFDEAGQALGQAKARAVISGDKVLASKIENYRAMDALDRHDYVRALEIITAANITRTTLGAGLARGDRISASEARRLEGGVASGRRSLLVSIGTAEPADRLTILSAQGDYVAGTALHGLGRSAEALRVLDSGLALLDGIGARQQSLAANILNEEAQVRLATGDAGGALRVAADALRTLQSVVPGTRNEALLWLTLSQAQARSGRTAEAIASGRAGVATYARQLETPGMPPEVAAPFLDLLAGQSANNPAIASEYFETLALVWDGAASRSAAQLAARLVLSQGGGQARAYQDAERLYRAAIARREAVAADNSAAPPFKTAASAAVVAALAELRKAEGALRQSAPAYLELLNPKVKTPELIAALHDGEGYLRVVIAERAAYGALVDKEGVHPYRIDQGAPSLGKLVDRLRASTRAGRGALPDFDIASAMALHQAVLGPIQAPLAKLKSLQVDVGGALAAFPLAALVRTAPTGEAVRKAEDAQDYTGVDWVARHIAVTNTLGPATFVRLRNTTRPATAGAGLTAAVYGDFKPEAAAVAARLAKLHGLSDTCREEVTRSLALLTALPDTADEAKAVATAVGSGARLRLNADFTDADVLKSPEAGDADVLLLATHGVLGLSSCFAEPALLTSLSPDDPSSGGLIEASQLLDRKLKARLVVLSACDTAGGGQSKVADTGVADGGEALSGLARGFIYAGAANVMATEWKIDSASAALEISALLKMATTENLTVGEALAKAQAGLYADPERAHPFYWAAFILIGDGAVRLKPAPAPAAPARTTAALVAQPPAP